MGNGVRSCTHTAGRGPDPGGFINHSARTQPGLEVSKHTNTQCHTVRGTVFALKNFKGLKRAAKGEDRKGNNFLSWGLIAGHKGGMEREIMDITE